MVTIWAKKKNIWLFSFVQMINKDIVSQTMSFEDKFEDKEIQT